MVARAPDDHDRHRTLGEDSVDQGRDDAVALVGLGAEADHTEAKSALGDYCIDRATLGPYLWEGWEEPAYHLALKESYAVLQSAFADLPGVMEERR